MSTMKFTSDLPDYCRRRAHAWALVLPLAAAALAGCSGGDPPAPAAVTPHNVTLTEAQRQKIHLYTVAPSQYRSSITTTGLVDFDRNRTTPVLAPFSGPVNKLLVTLGQQVTIGQALAHVDSPDFITAVGAYRKALITARAADAVAVNDRALYAQQAISARENAQAQADAVGADSDRTAALQSLVALHVDPKTIADIRAGRHAAQWQGVIRAPIAGTVVEKSIALGETLAAGSTPCFTIADTGKMWVMADVFGADVSRVRTGDEAEVDLGDDGKPLTGTVTNVASVVDPATRSVSTRVLVDNPDGVLKKGMYVEVRIRSHDAHTGLLIPVAAVLRDDENLPFVYLVAPDGSYARHAVTLGQRVGDRFVVPAGLKPGDKVVVDDGIFLHFIETQ